MFIPWAQPHAQSLFQFPIVFGINLIHFFDEKDGAAGNSIVCFGASIPCHVIWQKRRRMRTVSKSATYLATESVNSAPFKRGVRERGAHFWQGKVQNSSPILRCTFWQGKVQNSLSISALLRWLPKIQPCLTWHCVKHTTWCSMARPMDLVNLVIKCNSQHTTHSLTTVLVQDVCQVCPVSTWLWRRNGNWWIEDTNGQTRLTAASFSKLKPWEMACAPLGIHVLFFLNVWRNTNRYTQYGIPCNTQHFIHSCHLNAFYNIAHCTMFNAAHDSHSTQFCMFHAAHCTQSWWLVHSGTEHANQPLKIIHSFFFFLFFFSSVAALLESQMDHLEAEVRLKVLRQRKSPASQRCHRASQRCHRASQRCHRVNTRWAAQTGQFHPPDSRPLIPLPRCRLTIPWLREQHHFSLLLQHDPHRHQPHTQSTSLHHLSCSWRTEWVVRWRAESRQCRHTAHPPIWWTRRFSSHHKEVSVCRSLLYNSRHVLVAKLSSYTLPIWLDISDYELCHLFADISVRLLNLDKRLSFGALHNADMCAIILLLE